MKKLLLFIITCSIVISVNAQYKTVNINGVKVRVNKNDKPAPVIKSNIGEVQFPLKSINKTTHNYSSTKSAATPIGVSTYDLQTNASIDDRVSNFSNTTSAIWTFSITNSLAAPDRGTGYNHYDGSAWGTAPSTRVETVRTGWPSIGITANGAEHIIAHEFALFAMKHNTRPTAGTGAWTQNSLPLTNGTLFNDWPRLAVGGTDGNSLHLIDILAPVGNGGSLLQGMDGPITYSRSEDAGVTWNIAHDILPGYDSTLYAAGVGADAYAIDAIGTNVAIVAGGITEDWAIWKSTDNGTTFTKIIVSDFPFDNYDD
ncbi:MAG: hypothetical protein HKN75_02590, partial [Bacteroidia bacterium]|nr:hypothetical protein [Bacteroidia bacterium]